MNSLKNIILLPYYAHVNSPKQVKDKFYNKLDEIWDRLQGNIVNLLLGDLNAICGRELQHAPIIGKKAYYYKQ